MTFRVHITGASGAGTSTLGKALAQALSIRFFDTDDYYWEDTDPPFQVRTEAEPRIQRMNQDLGALDSWVLSGSLDGWGDQFIPMFDVVIFVRLDSEIRMKRMREREISRFGNKVLPGGEMYESNQAFLKWTAEYDASTLPGRSLKRHESWLSQLPCPVIRVSSDIPVEEMVAEVLSSESIKRLQQSSNANK